MKRRSSSTSRVSWMLSALNRLIVWDRVVFSMFPRGSARGPGGWSGIRGVSLMFKWTWQNVVERARGQDVFLLTGLGFMAWPTKAVSHRRRVCENQPLANGGRLVVEAIRLTPQTGFPAHTHEHDLMLVLLRGQMHGLGHVTAAPAVIYYPAGTAHGLSAAQPGSHRDDRVRVSSAVSGRSLTISFSDGANPG